MPRNAASPSLPGTCFRVAGNDLHLVHAPEDRLAATMSLIHGAKYSIRMFSYMFANDQSGREVLTALVEAAQRGVQVQLIIDSFGSGDISDEFFDPLIKAGGRYHSFGSRWGWGYLIRNHQKIMIADENHVLVGGFNITDEYFGRAGNKSWEDMGIILSGPKAASLVPYYDNLALLSADGSIAFTRMRRLISSWQSKDEDVQWLLSGPTNRISPLGLAYKKAMEKASRVEMVMAYFSPSQTVARRIARVTRKGNGSRLVMAGKTDNGATISAARLLYRYFLKRSAKIYEYQTRPLHMKLLLVDDIVYIGSANFDVRSLFINMEIMLMVRDERLAAHMRSLIDTMVQQSEEQTLALLEQRDSRWSRIKSGLAWFLVNTVDYTIGRRISFNLLKRPD